MKVDHIDSQPCPVAKALAQIGDAWSMLILREAFYGRQRFSDFVTHTGAQKTVVSARLKRLVEHGVLRRVVYSEYPTRHNYTLTAKGRALAPVLYVLSEWGDTWASDAERPAITLTHNACGHQLGATVVCGTCGEQLDAGNVTPAIGPGYPAGLPDPFARQGVDD